MYRSKEKKTQIHERRRGYKYCGGIEYTLDGANAFTVLDEIHAFKTHAWMTPS